MNKELSKTLTTALVQFIDRERPEGTMCCSSYECEQIEKAFEGGCYDEVENLIKKKLTGLTEFEQCLLDYANARNEFEFDSTRLVELNNKVIELTKSYAKTLLAFIDSLQQEQPCDGLEEEAEEWAENEAYGKSDAEFEMAYKGFKAGAQWMKEQMMKDAVEGTLAGQLLSSLTENGKQMVITVPRNKFPSNPKTKSIKLIIVKEN